MDTAVLKVGGSIITAPDQPATQNDGAMNRTAEEIATYDGDLVLVHGAGSYGHPQVEQSNLHSGLSTNQDRLDFARIQRLQNELNALYCNILQDHDVPAFPVQPSATAIMNNEELARFDIGVVTRLLDRGMVPVLYGVPVVDDTDEVAILSGDVLAPYIAQEITADYVLHATDVEGVYQQWPPDAGEEPLQELTSMPATVTDANHKTNVTGGMRGKLEQLFEYGQDGMIFDGAEPGNIKVALSGSSIGTAIEGSAQ